MRSRAIAQQKTEGDNPYPHKFHVELSLPEFIDRYHDLEAGTVMETDVSVSGKQMISGNQMDSMPFPYARPTQYRFSFCR